MPTKIPWTQETWNPVVGCTKIRAGCQNCYAERLTRRFWRQWHCQAPPWHFAVTTHENRLEQPLHWKEPRRVFICSMGDLFHGKVPEEFIYRVLLVTQQANWHTYQILTKRPHRAYELLDKFYGTSDGVKWPFSNVWLGPSCSTQKDADEMIPVAVQIPAAVRFVSFEPLLEEIGGVRFDSCREDDTGLDEYGQHIDWLIIGCERLAGNRAGRFCDDEQCWWAAAKSLVEQAEGAQVPVFFKQGPINGKVSTKLQEWPVWARVQEWPK